VIVAAGLGPACIAPLGLAGAFLGWWCFLDSGYASALGEQKRSAKRRGRDRQVATQSFLIWVTALAAGLVGLLDHGVWITRSAPLGVCLAVLALLGFSVFSSSLVDWYYIRPLLDGVVREPPCRSSREEIWMTVTRRWYRHRSIAELVAVATIAVAFTALMAAIFVRGHPGIETLVTVAGVPIALLAGLQVQALDTLRRYGIDPPRLWLGDLLEDPTGSESAYLVHVTVRGIVVRERNPRTGAWSGLTDVTFDEVAARRYRGEPFTGCEECALINPECEWKPPEPKGGRRRRLVV
jgi:hypothetical protein